MTPQRATSAGLCHLTRLSTCRTRARYVLIRQRRHKVALAPPPELSWFSRNTVRRRAEQPHMLITPTPEC
jgi:hypothetical protein